VNRILVEDGFNLDAAISSITWVDADTLLLASSHGGALNSTASGKPRTIRLWRRGQLVDNAEILFSTAHESERVGVERDWSVGRIRLYLTETTDGDRRRHYIAQGDFDFKMIGLPQDVRCEFGSDLAAVHLRQDWTTATESFPMDTLLVMSVDDHGACVCPEVLWEGTGGSALHDFQFINGCICINLIEHLRPLLKLFIRGANGWREGQMPPLITDGVICIKPLNHFAHEMDSTVVITEESPTLPKRVSLSTLDTREAPRLLRQSRQVYDATDVVIEYHSVYMEDVGPIPYVHIGGARTKGTNMPLYMCGYGGFGGFVLPTYNKILGVLVYQHGWSTVITCLPGDGTNGLRYERAGRKEFKIRAHDAFATVAKDLVERGVTEASRIVAAGASNGGLMTGMMLPRFPDRFAALACELPLTDLRRFQRWSAGQAWAAEYPLCLKDRLKISPCDNIPRATQDAPHMLVFTNRLDDRVHPAHARRYAYLLQEYGHNALFFEAKSGGHGYGANTLQIAQYFALRHSFYRRGLAGRD
jgi:prolyl oligopeptidase